MRRKKNRPRELFFFFFYFHRRKWLFHFDCFESSEKSQMSLQKLTDFDRITIFYKVTSRDPNKRKKKKEFRSQVNFPQIQINPMEVIQYIKILKIYLFLIRLEGLLFPLLLPSSPAFRVSAPPPILFFSNECKPDVSGANAVFCTNHFLSI